jgi:hypothetical protein
VVTCLAGGTMFVLQKDARQMMCIVSNKQTFPPPTLPVESVPLADSRLLTMMIRYDVKTCQNLSIRCHWLLLGSQFNSTGKRKGNKG